MELRHGRVLMSEDEVIGRGRELAEIRSFSRLAGRPHCYSRANRALAKRRFGTPRLPRRDRVASPFCARVRSKPSGNCLSLRLQI